MKHGAKEGRMKRGTPKDCIQVSGKMYKVGEFVLTNITNPQDTLSFTSPQEGSLDLDSIDVRGSGDSINLHNQRIAPSKQRISFGSVI